MASGESEDEAEDVVGVHIPPERLSPETLRGVLEEFVTRDGTNLAEAEQKVEQVAAQIRRGTAQIWYDPTSGTCTVRPSG